MGKKALRQLQLGQETSAGTPVAPTAIWRGMGAMDDVREVMYPEEDVGLLVPPIRSYIPKLEATLEMDEIEATFEQLPYILHGGIDAITPTQDGTGTGYIWDYAFPTSVGLNPQPFTIRMGDDVEVEEMEYSLVRSFTLSGQFGEAWNMGAEWFGRQVTGGKSFESLSLASIEEILFGNSALYIDDPSSGYGVTQVSGILRSATLEVETGVIPLPVAGNLYFGVHGALMPEITLEITMEWESDTVTEKGYQRDQTTRLIELNVSGSALGTPDTYSNKTLKLQLPGRWQNFEPLDSEDGNDIVTATFKVGYDPTVGDAGHIIVVNEESSLT